jgi:hypothetical protein
LERWFVTNRCRNHSGSSRALHEVAPVISFVMAGHVLGLNT